MKNIIHVSFDSALDGIEAVKSLLRHGVRAEDIDLILPQSEYTGQAVVHARQEVGRTAANPSSAQDIPLPAARRVAAERLADALLPEPPQLTALFPRCVKPHETDFAAADHTSGYRYDALGAVLRDPEPAKPPASPIGSSHEAVASMEQEVGPGMATSLSVAVSGALNEAEILHLLQGFGGHVIPQAGQL